MRPVSIKAFEVFAWAAVARSVAGLLLNIWDIESLGLDLSAGTRFRIYGLSGGVILAQIVLTLAVARGRSGIARILYPIGAACLMALDCRDVVESFRAGMEPPLLFLALFGIEAALLVAASICLFLPSAGRWLRREPTPPAVRPIATVPPPFPNATAAPPRFSEPSSDTMTRSCPHCDGLIPFSATKCRYCKSTLAN